MIIECYGCTLSLLTELKGETAEYLAQGQDIDQVQRDTRILAENQIFSPPA